MLWDGAPIHRANVVNEFLEENEKRITAFRLPPYHPKFNPTEFLWSYLKVSKMRGFCPMQISDLKKKITRCVRSAKKKPDMVRSYFGASAIPIGDGAEEKLSRYCKPELIRKLCIYQ